MNDDAPPDVCRPQPVTEAPFTQILWWQHEFDLCHRTYWQPPCEDLEEDVRCGARSLPCPDPRDSEASCS